MTYTAAKVVVGGSFAAFCTMVGFGYTNPAWTQRRFDPAKVPPLKHDTVPTRDMCLEKLISYSTPENAMDVLVIGGGCVGTGVALDAVTRGLTVGLVDMGDYAGETSSRSTKLVHGGIRYLRKAIFQADPKQLKLVVEGLQERTIIIHQAPHLCHPLPTIVPCYHAHDIFMYWWGAKLYDVLAALYGGTLNYSHFVFPYETMKAYPKLKKINPENSPLLGSIRYYDGQMNDARLCFSVAMTAASYGAATVNYAKVKAMEVVKDNKGDEVVRTTVEDTIHKKTVDVYSKSVVNAGGPFSAEIEHLAKRTEQNLNMFPASGTHVIIDRKYCPKEHEAMIVPSTDDRVVFTIPWQGGCLIGTTDHKCKVQTNPPTDKADVEFLVKNVEPYVGNIPKEAVRASWTGIRPLATPKAAAQKAGGMQNIVREYVITVNEQSRILDITGGKWTTYRKMAEEAVNKLSHTLMKGRAEFKPCCTTEMVMVGARHLSTVPETPENGIPADVHQHWRSNYGDRYHTLAAMVAQNPALLKRLDKDSPVVEAEVIYAVKNEHCEKIMDFVARRTRTAFVNTAQAERMVPRVAELMAQEKGWGFTQRLREKSEAHAFLSSFK